MAIVAVFERVGMSVAHYDEVIQKLDAVGEGTPDGRLYHACATTDEGLLVVDVWDSEEQFARFAATLMPLIQQEGAGAVGPRIYPVHNIMAP